MRRIALACLVAVVILGVALPAEAGFRSLANEIDQYPDLDRVWIPFFGLARFVVKVAHPEGIHDIKLAIFEDKGGAKYLDLERLVDRHVDRGEWSPMVRTSSKREKVQIFVQERGDNIALLVAGVDGSEVIVIEAVLDPERFAEELAGDGDFISIAGR